MLLISALLLAVTVAPDLEPIVITDERALSTKTPATSMAAPRTEPFASFEVRDTSDPGSPTFVFSAARATNDDPVMISTPGRELTDADATEYRTSLQRHWLSVNVPDGYEMNERSLVECKPAGEWEFPFCDLYAFVDPETRERHEYYIFTGNWNYAL